MEPLDLLTPASAGRFSKPPERNAYVELHNLIAAADSVADFSPSDRGRISRRHGVDLAHRFADERAALYRSVLDHRLSNGDLDARDRHLLGHIARTLALAPADLRAAHERAFGRAATDAVDDDCLSAEERLLLYKLQHLLGLDPELADGAYAVIARERLLRVVASALCDGQLSAAEEAEIDATRRSLSLDMPPEITSMMNAARARWQILQGELVAVDVPIRVAEGESGRLAAAGNWSFASGDLLRQYIGESVLHSGRTAGLEVPQRVLRGRVRAGQIVLTSRRLVLVPDNGGIPDEYQLKAVSQLLRFRNGTVVRTRSGRRIFLNPGDDNEVFYAVLYRLVFGDPEGGPD